MAIQNRVFKGEEYCACWESRIKSRWREIDMGNGTIRAVPVWNAPCETHPDCEMPTAHIHKPEGECDPTAGYRDRPDLLGRTGPIREIMPHFVRTWKLQQGLARSAQEFREPEKRRCLFCNAVFETYDMRFSYCPDCREEKQRQKGPFTIACEGCNQQFPARVRRARFCPDCKRIRAL